MVVAVKTFDPTQGDLVKWEQEHRYCREVVTVLSGRSLALGSIIGRRRVDPTAANTTAAAVGGNTGNGTITKDATAPVQAGAKPGTYRVLMLSATAFAVYRPDGSYVGKGVAGSAFTTEIKFVIATGGTPMVAGDSFTVIVPAGDGKVVLAPYAAAAEGWHEVYGVLIQPVDATGADATGVAIVRPQAIVAAGALRYEAGYDDTDKKATAQAALKALGILPAATA
jgi:hypothetical protein